jgi:type IV secretion system protein VirB4
MSIDAAALLFVPSTVGALMASVAAAGATAMGAALLVSPISRKLMPMPHETRLVDFMPFGEMMADGETITTQRGDLVRIFKVAGAELTVTSQGESESLFHARRTWLSQIAEKKARARVFTTRTAIKPGELIPHPIAHLSRLADTWESAFQRNSFSTEHYIVLSVDKEGGIIAMDEASSLTMAALQPFKPKVLNDKGEESPLKILGRLASPVTRPNPRATPGVPVSEMIVSDQVHFADDKSGRITFTNGDKDLHVAIIGIKTWGDLTEEKMLLDMASLPFDYTIFHNIEPLGRTKATTTLDMQFRLARTTFMSDTAHMQFGAVSEIVGGGGEDTQCLCSYALSIIIEAPTLEELDRRISQINTIAAQYQVMLVREGIASQATWWSMFPTYDVQARPWKVLAANVATLLVMQRANPGAKFSPWGKSPVTMLRTSTGSPYNFVFHDMSDPSNKEPLGHMLLVGPSGSGKTVLVSWLAMMAMRFEQLRVFFFDRFNGTEVVTNMAGGRYIKFDGTGAAMNPLQMELTPRNKAYLQTWFQLITGLNDPASTEQFGRAIDMLELMPIEDRNLKRIQQTVFAPDSEARNRIRPWIMDNQHGQVFCAPQDTMDLDGRMISFDFTTILNPDRKDNLGPAVVSYTMHRTMDVSVQQGHPAIYFVDETAPLLKNEYFAAKFAAGLQEGRKLGQVFICAFQRPNAIEESGHGQTILGQCATQVFFPNAKAKKEDFAFFGLTDREMNFVLGKSHNHLQRKFLLRRISETDGIESVVIDADMRALGDGLQTFASGNAAVRKIRELMDKDPENFRKLYMESVAAERMSA